MKSFRPEALLRVALWTLLAAVITYTRTDPDLWGHVRFGLDILRERGVPAVDPYSFTSDQPWINHEWASEALFGASFAAAGASGLVMLKLAVVGSAWLLLLRQLRLDGLATPRVRDWFGAAAVITTVQQAHHVRPQIFSLWFFTALLTCLVSSERPRGRAWLFVVPLLFAAWANFHGGWIVGGAVLLLWTLGSALWTGGARARVVSLLIVTGGLSLIATLANPYGFGLWRFLWETVGINRADIAEWQPVYALDFSVWMLWIATAALAVTGVVRGGRSLDPRRVLVVSGLAFGSFFVNRLLGFFAISTLFFLASAIAGRGAAPVVPNAAPARRGARVTALVMAAAMSAAGVIAIVANAACIRVDQRTAPEPEALSALQAQTAGSRLLVWFDWGEYAIWHLAPRFKVSLDGRRETVYSGELQDRHLRFFFDAPGGAGLITQIGADYVWIPSTLPAARRLSAIGWTALYRGQTSTIFVRPGLPIGAAANPSGPNARCFPEP